MRTTNSGIASRRTVGKMKNVGRASAISRTDAVSARILLMDTVPLLPSAMPPSLSSRRGFLPGRSPKLCLTVVSGGLRQAPLRP